MIISLCVGLNFVIFILIFLFVVVRTGVVREYDRIFTLVHKPADLDSLYVRVSPAPSESGSGSGEEEEEVGEMKGDREGERWRRGLRESEDEIQRVREMRRERQRESNEVDVDEMKRIEDERDGKQSTDDDDENDSSDSKMSVDAYQEDQQEEEEKEVRVEEGGGVRILRDMKIYSDNFYDDENGFNSSTEMKISGSDNNNRIRMGDEDIVKRDQDGVGWIDYNSNNDKRNIVSGSVSGSGGGDSGSRGNQSNPGYSSKSSSGSNSDSSSDSSSNSDSSSDSGSDSGSVEEVSYEDVGQEYKNADGNEDGFFSFFRTGGGKDVSGENSGQNIGKKDENSRIDVVSNRAGQKEEMIEVGEILGKGSGRKELKKDRDRDMGGSKLKIEAHGVWVEVKDEVTGHNQNQNQSTTDIMIGGPKNVVGDINSGSNEGDGRNRNGNQNQNVNGNGNRNQSAVNSKDAILKWSAVSIVGTVDLWAGVDVGLDAHIEYEIVRSNNVDESKKETDKEWGWGRERTRIRAGKRAGDGDMDGERSGDGERERDREGGEQISVKSGDVRPRSGTIFLSLWDLAAYGAGTYSLSKILDKNRNRDVRNDENEGEGEDENVDDSRDDFEGKDDYYDSNNNDRNINRNRQGLKIDSTLPSHKKQQEKEKDMQTKGVRSSLFPSIFPSLFSAPSRPQTPTIAPSARYSLPSPMGHIKYVAGGVVKGVCAVKDGLYSAVYYPFSPLVSLFVPSKSSSHSTPQATIAPASSSLFFSSQLPIPSSLSSFPFSPKHLLKNNNQSNHSSFSLPKNKNRDRSNTLSTIGENYSQYQAADRNKDKSSLLQRLFIIQKDFFLRISNNRDNIGTDKNSKGSYSEYFTTKRRSYDRKYTENIFDGERDNADSGIFGSGPKIRNLPERLRPEGISTEDAMSDNDTYDFTPYGNTAFSSLHGSPHPVTHSHSNSHSNPISFGFNFMNTAGNNYSNTPGNNHSNSSTPRNNHSISCTPANNYNYNSAHTGGLNSRQSRSLTDADNQSVFSGDSYLLPAPLPYGMISLGITPLF